MVLIFSIAALIAGPLLYAAVRRFQPAKAVLDGLIALAIAFIILFHIIPEAWHHARYWALLLIAVGVVFPVILERLFRRAHETAHLAIVTLAAFGLVLHAIVDGIALQPSAGNEVAWAIILHRVPVGIAIWWVVRPNLGWAIAMTLFAAIIIATSSGYFLGQGIFEVADSQTIALLQAFIVGSLAHVTVFGVKHRH